MGWVHYVGRAPSRERLVAGDTPAWIANSKRRRYIAAIVLSCPTWVDRRDLMTLRAWAVVMTKMTGVPHVLDHLVPINHPRVCGLSVPWNVRVIPEKVNGAKSNNWCPEQQELFE